jgi:ATPase subunit of ABC transporter with duplicated ATPase domains
MRRRAVQRDHALVGSAQTTQERHQRRSIPGQRRYLATAQPHRAADLLAWAEEIVARYGPNATCCSHRSAAARPGSRIAIVSQFPKLTYHSN